MSSQLNATTPPSSIAKFHQHPQPHVASCSLAVCTAIPQLHTISLLSCMLTRSTYLAVHPTVHSSCRLSVQVHQLNPHVFIIESCLVACPQACPRKNLPMEICMTFIFLVEPQPSTNTRMYHTCTRLHECAPFVPFYIRSMMPSIVLSFPFTYGFMVIRSMMSSIVLFFAFTYGFMH